MTMRAPAFHAPDQPASSDERATTALQQAKAPVLCVLPGTPESASAARQMARQLLGDGHPAVETVQLVVSELVTNAIVHSKSGTPGGTVTVALCPGSGGVLVQVRDDGGPSEPRISREAAYAGHEAEQGYGLLLVDALADRWGTISSPDGRITWCRIGVQASETNDPGPRA
ncbi:MAG TPA: ATP-binding protein [Streptosporangiaceae bacterium]|nr:ATP-binding protein [Streptosporangiaceae bacterium]